MKFPFDLKSHRSIIIKKITIIYFYIFSFVLLLDASLGKIGSMETDSHILPTISIEYRGSLTMCPDDLTLARRDYPEMYKDIYDYDDLRSSKLIRSQKDPDIWIAYYFPIYGLTCMPLKLLLQFLGFPQIRTFTITNALLVILSYAVVIKYLKASDETKLICILLLSASPIIHYVNLIYYEAMMYSFIVIALVMYHNKNYCRAGVFITLASWANPAVLVLGAVIIADYLIDILIHSKGKTVKTIITENWKYTALHALSYIGFVIPFIFNKIYIGKLSGTLSHEKSDTMYFDRIFAYFFDPDLGFASFAFLLLAAAITALPIMIAKKNYRCLYYYAALIGVVSAFSLMRHINCGMLSCARYVIWSYPILAFLGVYIFDSFKTIRFYPIIWGIIYLSCVGTAAINVYSFKTYMYHNKVTTVILDNFPELYRPMPSTFYSRTLHIDGAYNEKGVAVYSDSRNDEVRKILFSGTRENKENILESFICTEGDPAEFEALVNKIPEDNKFHFLNFNIFSDIQIHQLTADEESKDEKPQELYSSGNTSE